MNQQWNSFIFTSTPHTHVNTLYRIIWKSIMCSVNLESSISSISTNYHIRSIFIIGYQTLLTIYKCASYRGSCISIASADSAGINITKSIERDKLRHDNLRRKWIVIRWPIYARKSSLKTIPRSISTGIH